MTKDFDDLAADAGGLAVLLDVVTDLVVGRATDDAAARAHLNKVAALLTIARDQARRLASDADTCACATPGALPVCMTGGN